MGCCYGWDFSVWFSIYSAIRTRMLARILSLRQNGRGLDRSRVFSSFHHSSGLSFQKSPFHQHTHSHPSFRCRKRCRKGLRKTRQKLAHSLFFPSYIAHFCFILSFSFPTGPGRLGTIQERVFKNTLPVAHRTIHVSRKKFQTREKKNNNQLFCYTPFFSSRV